MFPLMGRTKKMIATETAIMGKVKGFNTPNTRYPPIMSINIPYTKLSIVTENRWTFF